MTYSIFEASTYSGNPIELYEFNRSDSVYWRYTSTDQDITYSGHIYESAAISRGSIENSQDGSKSAVSIEMPYNLGLPYEYRESPPTDIITLTIYRYHYGDSDVTTIRVGRVLNISFGANNKAIVTCENLLSSLKQAFPRKRYQVSCQKVLYSADCGVLADSYKISTTLTGVSGLDLTSPDFTPEGYLTGGYLVCANGDAYEKRFITDHTGTTITINLSLSQLIVGSEVFVYPGCQLTTDDCFTKFNNILNHGGFPFSANKNPFGGTPIY